MAYTTIDKSTDYFNTVLYTGNSSTQSITGVGFQPDFVWIKDRIGATSVYSHHLFDVIRGSTKYVLTNATDAEATDANTLTSFDSDGFSLGSDASTNASGDATVAWNWLASGSTASNTDGSITSTVSANTTAGFSIVKYDGTRPSVSTVGHGLGATPSVIWFKSLNAAQGWRCWFANGGFDNQSFLTLNSTGAKDTGQSNIMNNTAPTSTVFTVGDDADSQNTNMIAYCFTDIKGFSKSGSYTGNGNADGTFVYTGFKPAWVMIKRTDSTSDWYMYDNKRDSINVMSRRLEANNSDAEVNSGTAKMDFVSNGIKFRGTDSAFNVSSATYIYMAFAEEPFVTSGGIPNTAR